MKKTAGFISGIESAVYGAARAAPTIGGMGVGALGGMLLSRAVSPAENRDKYLFEGAVIGGAMGYAKMQRHPSVRNWHGVTR